MKRRIAKSQMAGRRQPDPYRLNKKKPIGQIAEARVKALRKPRVVFNQESMIFLKTWPPLKAGKPKGSSKAAWHNVATTKF